MITRQERPRILVGHADRGELRLLVQVLHRAHFRVLKAITGHEIIELAIEHVPDVILIDVALREPDGLATLASLREWYRKPVLMLTEPGELEAEVQAFALGATSVISLPIGEDELVLRIEAVHNRFTRKRVSRSGSFIRIGTLLIDLASRQASLSGKRVNLTSTEFALLGALAQNLNRVVTSEELITLVWGGPESGTIDSLRTYIKQIRRKIQPSPESPSYLSTVTGVGYCLVSPEERQRSTR